MKKYVLLVMFILIFFYSYKLLTQTTKREVSLNNILNPKDDVGGQYSIGNEKP